MDPRVKAGHFLNDQLSAAQRSLIPTTLRQAYVAADALASDEPLLEVPSAVDNRGRIRSWAADLAFERLIKSGQWPFDYEWATFDKPTGRYLKVRLESATLSISLIEMPKKPPRLAKFRQNNAFANPPYLFPEMNEESHVEGVPGFVLVHGHKQLDFAHLGMAHPRKRRWLYRTPNLMKMPHAIEDDLPPVEATDEEAILTLKHEIEKWRRDSGND